MYFLSSSLGSPSAGVFLNLKNVFGLYNAYIQNIVLQLSQIFCWASQWQKTPELTATINMCVCAYVFMGVCVCPNVM